VACHIISHNTIKEPEMVFLLKIPTVTLMRKIFIIGLIFVSLLLSGCGNFDENIDENKNDIKLNG
jgi:hypothetical protein